MARYERARAKRVTDPLDDKVKARLVGMHRCQLSYISSGSEHDGVDDDSPCLSDLVQGFFEEDHDAVTTESSHTAQSHSEGVDSEVESTEVIDYRLNPTGTDNADSVRDVLWLHVLKAMDVFSCLRSNKPMFRRNVMSYLRDIGYNAAICKSKWESCGGLTGGNYEYIDVVASSHPSSSASAATQNRYIVDLEFAGEFEVARPTEQYARMAQTLPRVFVGRGEEVKKVVRVMCDAAKRSLKSRDLHFPPWRKSRYMLMKWFGPYKRTTSLIPANSAVTTTIGQSAVKCRSVGFDTGVSDVNGRYFVHA